MRNVAMIALLGVTMVVSDPQGSSPKATPNDGCGCEEMASQQESPKPPPHIDELEGNGVGAHDPAMAKEGRSYYLFCTGPGISMRTSKDRLKWSASSGVFEHALPWTGTTIPGSREFYWAPDISYFNHKWHLYYAVSTFGRNRSAIGLATNVTLDPTNPEYHWQDDGPAVQSYATDNYNAIDPNLSFDEKGHPWMAFGSFWSGIKILKIDPATGKPESADGPPLAIASRARPGAIEAPSIMRHGRDFYLFTSFDICCRGVNSTYNIRVGRSSSITGPYVDRDGKPMMEGGGTLVLATHGRWHGPGGNSVLRDGRKDLLVYHAYDASANGAPKLRIEQINWDKDGWPHVPSANEVPPK
jgi:arabinan endo-1,5-alpha-L-arabinosidase